MKPKLHTNKSPSRKSDNYQIEKHLRNFCSGSSLELKKMLGVIIGELDYALSTPNQTVREHSMTVALSATERALQLSNNLKYFAEQTQISLQLCDLSMLLLETADELEKELEIRKIKIKVLAESPMNANLDVRAMCHAFSNLIQFLVLTMPAGGEIALCSKREKNQVEITLSGNGHSLSEALLDEMLNPYQSLQLNPQLDSNRLGLLVSMVLIESHGGVLSVRAQSGQQTTFSIHLPLDTQPTAVNNYAYKRQYPRVKVHFPAELALPDLPVIRATLVTLSQRGGFVLVPKKSLQDIPQSNKTGTLWIDYFFGQRIEIITIRIASISWNVSYPGLGLEFLDMNEKSQFILSGLLKGYLP